MIRKRTAAIVVMAVAAFMDLLDITIATIALPSMQRSLHATSLEVQWVLAGYSIAFATMLITGGRLGDIFGRKKIFLLGIAGFTLASLGSALSTSGFMLVFMRVLQGMFAGLMVPQLNASVVALYKPEERAPIWGIIGALIPLGSLTGMVLGGWLVTANILGSSWRSVFLINIPVGMVTLAIAAVVVPESKSKAKTQLDILGSVIGAAGIFTLLYALSTHLGGSRFWSYVSLASAMLAGFLWQQHRRFQSKKSSLLPLRLFRERAYSLGMLVDLLFSIGNGGYGLILTFFAQRALHLTALKTGLLIVPLVGASIFTAPLVVGLSKKFGKALIFLGGLMQAAAFLWLAQMIAAHGSSLSYWDIFSPFVLAGAGAMFAIMPLSDLTLADIAEHDAGIASGLLTTVVQIGMAIGVALAGSVFFSRVTGSTPAEVSRAAIAGFKVCIGAYLVAGLGSIILPRRRSRANVL